MKLDATDRRIINSLQGGFPVCERPFEAAAMSIGIEEQDLINRIQRLQDDGILSRFGPLFDAERLGGAVTLVAMRIPDREFDATADIVSSYPEVAHNYARSHDLNMWFVVAAETSSRIEEVLDEITARTGLAVYAMPKLAEYYVGLRLEA